MKIKLQIVTILFSCICLSDSFAQTNDEPLNDSSIFLIRANEELFIWSTTSYKNGSYISTLPKGELAFAVSFIPFDSDKGNDSCWHIITKEANGYVLANENVSATLKARDYLRTQGNTNESKRVDVANYYQSLKELNDINKIRKKYSPIGLGIKDWSWQYANSYSYSADFSIEVFNPTQKIIKYIWFTLSAKDAVGGTLFSYGKPTVTVKGIGPIDPLDTASFEFERVFSSRVIDELKISTIKVQYMDGTFKTVSVVKNAIMR